MSAIQSEEETIEVELRLPHELVEEIDKLAKAGKYGETPEAVIEHILNNVDFREEEIQGTLDIIADRGKNLVALGSAMADPGTTIAKLAKLAFKAGVPLRFIVR